jgi:branched-chain amino acid transport system substrate-binding protein
MGRSAQYYVIPEVLMNLRLLRYAIAPLLILLSCLKCFADTPASVKLGILASVSDEWATSGDNIVKGAKLAAGELNASGGVGGIQVELVVEDSREANSGAHRGIRFFIGPTGTPAGLALAPIIRNDPLVIVLTPSVGVRNFSDSATNIFNTRGIDEAGSKQTAAFAISKTWKTAGVLASQQPWESAQGRAFKSEFERRGGKIVYYDEPLPAANDLRTPITKLIEAKPEVVFLSNFNRIALASRQLKLLGFKGPILTTPLDASSIKNAEGALEGAVFASFIAPTESFAKKFLQAYKGKPDYGADAAYDAVMALGNALRSSKSDDSGDIITELLKVDINGAAGEFTFDVNRVAKRPLTQWTVADSEIVAFEWRDNK